MRSDIRILVSATIDILDWLNGVGGGTLLPDANTVSTVWCTLHNEKIVRCEKFQKQTGSAVIVLHQLGVQTPPEIIWPEIHSHILQMLHSGEPIWLVLTGGMTLQREIIWQRYLDLTTPGDPPLVRLIIEGMITALLLGMPYYLLRILARVNGRMRTWKF